MSTERQRYDELVALSTRHHHASYSAELDYESFKREVDASWSLADELMPPPDVRGGTRQTDGVAGDSRAKFIPYLALHGKGGAING